MNPKAKPYIDKARKTIARMDKSDHENGYATPVEVGPVETVRTAMCAIEAGIALKDWDCVAEGYVMLEQIAKVYK